MSAYFVAGTDTGVGKTRVAVALLYGARQRGLTTLGLKPVAAGCEVTAEGLHNEDALLLRAESSVALPYAQTNPVALEPPIAPHIAAARAGVSLSAGQLAAHCRPLLSRAELTLVEGAGGWRVPLNDSETMADLALALQLPVILVVGIRLGCLNHALLSAEAIQRDGLTLAGWVANGVDPRVACADENIATLQTRLAAPCVGVVPPLRDPSPAAVAAYLNFTPATAGAI